MKPSRITYHASRAFTLLEIMIAMFIFTLILTAIYSIWHGIMKGTAAGVKAVQEVQRSRVTMQCIEQAFLSARVFTDNMKYYYFIGESHGERSAVSMTCRLPSEFLGMGFASDPNLRMRRVDFYTQPGSSGGDELVMTHVPMLIETNIPGVPGSEAYSKVLARDVTRFEIEYIDPKKGEWITDWEYTNTMPSLVRVTLGLGKQGASSTSHDLVSRIIAMPAQNIGGVQPGMRPGQPGFPGAPGVPQVPGAGPPTRPNPFLPGASPNQGGFRP
jgi:prepilin-type N-terminal cleavage/methylation domain-containing protein